MQKTQMLPSHLHPRQLHGISERQSLVLRRVRRNDQQGVLDARAGDGLGELPRVGQDHAGDLLDREPRWQLGRLQRRLRSDRLHVVVRGGSRGGGRIFLRLWQQHVEAAAVVQRHAVGNVLAGVQKVLRKCVAGVAPEQLVHALQRRKGHTGYQQEYVSDRYDVESRLSNGRTGAVSATCVRSGNRKNCHAGCGNVTLDGRVKKSSRR